VLRKRDRQCNLAQPDEVSVLDVGILHLRERDLRTVLGEERTEPRRHFVARDSRRVVTLDTQLRVAERTVAELCRVVVDLEVLLPVELTAQREMVEERERCRKGTFEVRQQVAEL